MMLRRLPSFGVCQRSGYQSIARSLGAINGAGHFHVQGCTSRHLATRALKPATQDPERPLRPVTSWVAFLQEYRQANPNGGKDALKAASTEWKALPDGQKKKYVDPCEAEKKVYTEKMKAYVASGKKDAWERDPDRPKTPPSAYIRFATEFRQKTPSLKITEASKFAAESWKDLKPEEKQRYEAAYKAAREQYDMDMKAYKASGKEAAWKAKVGIAAQEEKAAQEKEKQAEKVKMAKEKERAKKEKEKERAKLLKEKEKVKKQKEKLAAEAKQAKKKAKAAEEELKAKASGTAKKAKA